MKKILFPIFSFLFFCNCSYDNEEDLYGEVLCDTLFVSFSNDVSPIIANHCSSCHGGTSTSSASAGLLLVTYTQIRAAAIDSSYNGMIHRISRPEGDPLLMPGSYRIPQCEIDKIIAWVEQGTLDN